MKKFILTGLAMIMSLTSVMAQEETGIGNHLGCGVGIGTEGFNVSIATDMTKYAELEFGVNWLPGLSRTQSTDAFFIKTVKGENHKSAVGHMDVKAKANRATLDFKGSVYPFATKENFTSDLFVAVGVSFASKEIATIDGTLQPTVTTDEQKYIRVGKYVLPLDGNVADAYAEVNSVRPYLGLGYGRLVPKNNLGFRVELGCQFDGKVKIYKNDKELELGSKYGFEEAHNSQKVIDFFSIYPVLKFSLRGKFF